MYWIALLYLFTISTNVLDYKRSAQHIFYEKNYKSKLDEIDKTCKGKDLIQFF